MLETVNEVARLRNTRYGRPWPRHGLKLLYWFANECIYFDNYNNMCSECDPDEGDFGFHLFENRYDEYRNKLLPEIDFPYYVVGNLNSPGAEDLPDYVLEDKFTDVQDSNTDRIVVSLNDDDQFDRVYVTQHQDRSNYDPDATYLISRGLLMIIRRMSLQKFLEKTGYDQHSSYTPETTNTIGYRPHIQPVLPMPVHSYMPKTTNTAGPSITVVSVSEPPAAQSTDTIITLEDDTSTKTPQENSPKKPFWERLCTIL